MSYTYSVISYGVEAFGTFGVVTRRDAPHLNDGPCTRSEGGVSAVPELPLLEYEKWFRWVSPSFEYKFISRNLSLSIWFLLSMHLFAEIADILFDGLFSSYIQYIQVVIRKRC